MKYEEAQNTLEIALHQVKLVETEPAVNVAQDDQAGVATVQNLEETKIVVPKSEY